MSRILGRVSVLGLVSLLMACGGNGAGTESGGSLSEAALLGQAIFKDEALSASGLMSCATCHDPDRGHASPFDSPVAFGGVNFVKDQALTDKSAAASGLRLPPAIRYLKFNTAFGFDAAGTPSGGFFWDGRVNTLAEQAKKPFLGANEMANVSPQAVIDRLRGRPYAARFKQVFGQDIFDDAAAAFDRVAFALERYQQEDVEFAPFTSKFDAVNAGKAVFTAAELRGLTWFNRVDKGNCAACHPSTRTGNAPAALFTDFSYDSLGVPRNADIVANVTGFYDQGLCGPVRSDVQARQDLCGKFKVPSLRNVGSRKRFFHNGRFDNLNDVVRFYVTRDITPAVWYPGVLYDDLPASLRGNVNVTEGPYNRGPGQAPALTATEIDDLVAFLKTLTDGYLP
jgi:cytochrome c peroxidase